MHGNISIKEQMFRNKCSKNPVSVCTNEKPYAIIRVVFWNVNSKPFHQYYLVRENDISEQNSSKGFLFQK